MPRNYSEWVRGHPDAIANHCEVAADDYFVHIETDPYEGHVMIHVTAAKKLRAALTRAIKHVEATKRAGEVVSEKGGEYYISWPPSHRTKPR